MLSLEPRNGWLSNYIYIYIYIPFCCLDSALTYKIIKKKKKSTPTRINTDEMNDFEKNYRQKIIKNNI